MKRMIIIIALSLVPLLGWAGDRGVQCSKLSSVISEFRACDGFEVVRVGRIGTSAMKAITRIALRDGDQEAKAFLDLAKDINKIAIVDYEDCCDSDRDAFNRKIGRLLKDDCLIMEAKDGGDVVKIYGVSDDRNAQISDFVLFAPSDCALVCIFGRIPIEAISGLQ